MDEQTKLKLLNKINILLEEILNSKEESPFQLYCDLDGVLVDFEGGIVNTGNLLYDKISNNIDAYRNADKNDPAQKKMALAYKYFKKVQEQYGPDKMGFTFKDFESRETGAKAFNQMMYWYIASNKKWWIDLDWAPGGKELWAAISPMNPIILTSPVGTLSAEGKRVWCQNHLGLSGDRVIVVDSKNIDTGDKIGVLIDDRVKSIKAIESVGGIGILHVTGDTGTTLKALEKILRNQ